MEHKVDPRLWGDFMTMFIKAISKDTEPTELIKSLIENFFRDCRIDMFTLTPERSKDILKIDDINKEIKQRQSLIDKIKQNLIKYRDAQKEGESKDNVQLLTIAIVFAFIHLTILRERNRHYKDIYSKGSNETYENDLIQKVQEYKQYFIEMYDKWEDWRKSLISFENGYDKNIDFPCIVQDSFHDFYISFKCPNSIDEISENKRRKLCIDSQTAFINEAKSTFMEMYLFTFDLNKFLPGKWAAPSEAPNRKIGTLQYGILGKNTIPDPKHYGTDYDEDFQLSSDERGIIRGLNIHHSDVVHGLTVKYKDRPSITVGDVKGGEVTTIRGLSEDHYITSVEFYFYDRIISGIQFYFNSTPNSDILKSDVEANSTDLLGSDVNANRFVNGPTNDFKLVGIQMASSKSYSKKLDCLGYSLLTFEHLRIAE
ncbi:6076_t:CDS:2 [Cetraspora pellucida]|uniref:6076_t:CDS:1 n=1 Tax=Cetraspora pellucida TaxID=1433469 RepID=A0A9N9BN07_9GLOM|nr:6076_t:CDS:2 [Cetraspora pellucida]